MTKYKYTNKEIFDKVVDRLHNRNGRAVHNLDGSGPCGYLVHKGTPTENRCAAGVFLPNDHPCENFLGNWEAAVRKFPDLADIGDVNLITSLQVAHDNKYHWEEELFNERGEQYLKKVYAELVLPTLVPA